jgi:hypothetical protein
MAASSAIPRATFIAVVAEIPNSFAIWNTRRSGGASS